MNNEWGFVRQRQRNFGKQASDSKAYKPGENLEHSGREGSLPMPGMVNQLYFACQPLSAENGCLERGCLECYVEDDGETIRHQRGEF